MSSGAPERVLSISSRRGYRPSVRVLWTAAAVLVAVNYLIFQLHAYSVRHNRGLSYQIPRMKLDLDARADPWQVLLTDAALEMPCEVAQYEECPNLTNASEVDVARKQVLSKRTRELLANRSFSSITNLLKALSARDADDEVVKLAGQVEIALPVLAHFSTSWYIDTAERYAVNGREYDAVVLFRRFVNLMRIPVKRQEWLSIPGLDATDVPVLTDLFCTGSDRLSQDLCLVGMLKAIGRSTGGSLTAGVEGFLPAYEKLAPSLRSDLLVSYLKIWSAKNPQEIPSAPAHLTTEQEQAWHYATGVTLDGYARDLEQESACMRVLVSARTEYRKSAALGSEDSYFKQAAREHGDSIDELGIQLCQAKKSKKSSK